MAVLVWDWLLSIIVLVNYGYTDFWRFFYEPNRFNENMYA